MSAQGVADPTMEAQAIVDITREAQAGVLRPLDPLSARLVSVTIPDGYRRETIDLTDYLDEPLRAYGMVTLQTVDDFTRYVERHDDASRTTVWVDITSGRISAVLNDHSIGAANPGWGDHRATLALRLTDEWNHWAKYDGRLIDQETFAEHVEDGIDDIVDPLGAEMLEIVLSMQGHTSATWKSARRLQDGTVSFAYSEEATATAGGDGQLEIPQTFTLGIAPFLGEEAYRVEGRLRYRVKGGNLEIGYKLHRPDNVKRDALEHIADRLHGRFENRTFIGVPR